MANLLNALKNKMSGQNPLIPKGNPGFIPTPLPSSANKITISPAAPSLLGKTIKNPSTQQSVPTSVYGPQQQYKIPPLNQIASIAPKSQGSSSINPWGTISSTVTNQTTTSSNPWGNTTGNARVTNRPTQAATAAQNSSMQVGDQTRNAQNVLDASSPSALSQGATQAQALYGMLGNQRQLQPFSEGTVQGLDQSYVNLTRPQTTDSLAGRAALFDVQRGILQNAAQTTAENALAQQQLATQGATSVLNAGQPILGQPGQVPFNPLTQQQGTILGSQNGGNGLLVAGNISQLPQLQSAYTAMSNNMGAINGIENLLSNTLGGNQNISDINVINRAVNRLKSNTSSAEYNNFRTLMSSLGQLYSGYFSGSGQETDTTRRIGESLIDGTASAETIKSVLDTLKSEAEVRLSQLHNNIQQIANNPSYLPNPSVGGNQTNSINQGGFATNWLQ